MNIFKAINKVKNLKNNKVIQIARKIGAFVAAIPVIIKIVIVCIIITVASLIIDILNEWFSGENNPQNIYDTFGVEDVSELVEIKQNSDGGYYLDFIEGFDEKAKEVIKNSKTKDGLYALPDSPDFLKKLIKAEVVTQFPNLGGSIPEGSSGFQGAVDIVRVMPDKGIGLLESPGEGKTTYIEPEVTYDLEGEEEAENKIKSWKEGQKVVFNKKSPAYEKQEIQVGEWERKKDEKTSKDIMIEEGTRRNLYWEIWKNTRSYDQYCYYLCRSKNRKGNSIL